jgi:betR domain
VPWWHVEGGEYFKQAGKGHERRPLDDPQPRPPSRAGREETPAALGWKGSPQGGESRSAQADLAQILGMSRSAVSLRYTGKVAWRVDGLERVAWYLNFPVTNLLEKPKKARRVRSW